MVRRLVSVPRLSVSAASPRAAVTGFPRRSRTGPPARSSGSSRRCSRT